ncbi:MAG: hypothetical protein R2811_14945 [Flavobacteriales bacterium]
MILYVTYNDQPSGVYWSQVTDVVAYMNGCDGPRVRLVAFVSARGYRASRRAIHEHDATAWVLPMVPTMRRWRWNILLFALVCLWSRPSGIMARGIFATGLALRLRKWGLTRHVCYDARGAYAAEWEEYRLIDDDHVIAQFRPLERIAIHDADIRLAVSAALVHHWAERYQWEGDAVEVIPCTLGADHVDQGPERAVNEGGRVRLVYSGSTAGWQSFALLENMLAPVLRDQPMVDVLFLSRPDGNNAALQARFPGRVEVRWAPASEVAGLLAGCDMGLLLREDTVTNRVASPTKFAEYLAAGLPVLISPHIGDFSEAVRVHGLGMVIDKSGRLPHLHPTDQATSDRMRSYARQHLTKRTFDAAYRRILNTLS